MLRTNTRVKRHILRTVYSTIRGAKESNTDE